MTTEAGTLHDFYKMLRDFSDTLDFIRRIYQTVQRSDTRAMDSEKKELGNLADEGKTISMEKASYSADQRINFTVKVVENLGMLNSLLRASTAVQQLARSVKTETATNKLSENSAKMIQMLERITGPQLKMLTTMFKTLKTMEEDSKRFGYEENSLTSNSSHSKPQIFVGPIVSTSCAFDLEVLIAMIDGTLNRIVNLWGPPFFGKSDMTQKVLERLKRTEAYDDSIRYMNVKETPDKKMFTSKLLELLNFKGEVEDLDISAQKDFIKANCPKLLVLHDFPLGWEEFIEGLDFPNAGCKLLVVSKTKLSRFDAYGVNDVTHRPSTPPISSEERLGMGVTKPQTREQF